MTEEKIKKKARQRAEEIEEKQTVGVYDSEEALNQEVEWNKGYVSGYEDGYLAGAKENGVVWHDLRKNPDDLPERGYKVLAVYHDFDYTHLFAYLREDGVWTTNGHNAFDGIIAWCEIPKFEVVE